MTKSIKNEFVIPAQAGIHFNKSIINNKIPVSIGMTEKDNKSIKNDKKSNSFSIRNFNSKL